MIIPHIKALEGLVWGVVLGDGMNRMHRFRKPPFFLHSATGTWFLAVFQSVFSCSDLSLKLELLATPHYGFALRGEQPSLAHTLREVGANRHPSHQLIADVLPCMMPLIFFNGEVDDLTERIINLTHVTHWHPRVISSVTLMIGALRALLTDPELSIQGQLEQGEQLAEKSLHVLLERKEADTPQSIWAAYQALRHYTALAKGACDFQDLQVPLGFDARDCPEQLVVYILMLAQQENVLEEGLPWVLEQGGTSDILAPMLMAVVGLLKSKQAFPKEWFDILKGQDLFSRHLNALAHRDSYFPCLVEEEIRLSYQEQRLLKESEHLQAVVHSRNQLALFEDQVVKREFSSSK